MLAFHCIEQWHLFQYLAIIGDHGVQQTLQVPQITRDGAFVEQRSGVFQRTEQLALRFADVQREIELGQRMARAQAFQLQIAEGEIPSPMSCQLSMAWNTGLCDRLRTGLITSTTCSNGRS